MKKLLLSILMVSSIICSSTLKANASSAVPLDNSLNIISDYVDAFPIYEADIVDTSNHIYSFGEMEADIVELVQKYPNYLSAINLGMSVDNRRIWEIVVGNPSAPKAIYVQASVHGREWMNSWLVMKQIEYVCQNYNELLFDQICLCILPMVNPDGVTISQFGIEAITNYDLRVKLYAMPGASRFTRWKANANGVDINRNFSIGWNQIINTYKPASELYNGASAFSEPETLAVANAFSSRKYEAAITYHSMEGAVYWNVGQTGELYEKTQFLASQVSRITGYRMAAKSKVHGLDYNWMIFDQQTPTVLIETGTVACPLPYSQWNEIWTRNQNLLTELAYIYF